LITIYIKAYSGRLSALCGCAVAAGAGASAGIVFLLGGDLEQVEHSIMNMAGDITGIICDGGNLGCAMKAATGASAAVLCALLALRGIHVPGNTGIVAETVERTIANIGRISSPGMVGTNEVILNVMVEGENMAKR
jgi:L-cysteine desulfidase